MARRILIACVGNIFLGDDAFGVEVARRFESRSLPEGVRVFDFGIRSYDLAYAFIDHWDLIILVDAVPRGGQPGTVYVIEPDLPGAPPSQGAMQFDAHTMNPVAVLQMVAILGGKANRLLIVGCEPSVTNPEDVGMGLSAPVSAAVDEAVRVIEELITSFPSVPVGAIVR